jgi:hypothetical protein
MLVILALVSAILTATLVRTIYLEKESVKLKERNRLLCRENHRLRIKLKENEDSSKG